MTIHNAILTKNSAGGLGGGLASCIHGELSNLSTDGAAIYGNTAQATNFTTGTGRADRREVLQAALNEGTVTAGDAQDFFSAGDIGEGASGKGKSVVGDRMPGGGSHRWTGVDGGERISIGPGSAHYTQDYLVLTAHSTAADLAKLGYINGYTVDISGNSACNHGGGVATNGSLLFGSQTAAVVVDAVLDAAKKLQRHNTSTGAITNLTTGLAGYTFELVDGTGNVVAAAVTDDEGDVHLEIPADQFSTDETTYTFTLREQRGSDSDIIYDDAKYTVTVTLTPETRKQLPSGRTRSPSTTTPARFPSPMATARC